MECTSSEPTANICCTSQFLKSTLRARECELEWKALPRSHVGLFAFDPVIHSDDARNSVTTTTKSFLSTPTTFLTHFRPTDIGSRAVFDDRLCNDHLRVFFFFHISSQPPRRSIGTGRRNISPRSHFFIEQLFFTSATVNRKQLFASLLDSLAQIQVQGAFGSLRHKRELTQVSRFWARRLELVSWTSPDSFSTLDAALLAFTFFFVSTARTRFFNNF